MSDDNELVMYIVARADLGMSPGKLAAQVGHAVHYAIDMSCYRSKVAWDSQSATKIVLQVGSENELRRLHELTCDVSCLVNDEGRTEIAPTVTALGFVPMTKTQARPIVGHLKLYR